MSGFLTERCCWLTYGGEAVACIRWRQAASQSVCTNVSLPQFPTSAYSRYLNFCQATGCGIVISLFNFSFLTSGLESTYMCLLIFHVSIIGGNEAPFVVFCRLVWRPRHKCSQRPPKFTVCFLNLMIELKSALTMMRTYFHVLTKCRYSSGYSARLREETVTVHVTIGTRH